MNVCDRFPPYHSVGKYCVLSPSVQDYGSMPEIRNKRYNVVQNGRVGVCARNVVTNRQLAMQPLRWKKA